ncbi:MAG: class I SAM-dependent methyltransferase, partial [Pseudomonadota bacterium]
MRYAAPRRRVRPDTRAPLDLSGRLSSVVAGDLSADAAYRVHAVEPLGMAGRTIAAAPDRGLPKHCPVCGGAYGLFLSFGRARRRNAVCPGCGSLERHRFLWLYLRDTLRLPYRRATILHIAPEPGIRAQLSEQPRIRYIAVDLYRPDVPHAMDVTDLTIADSSIDLVLCSHVLEHVERDRRALAEFARILRPGGRAIILVPMDRRRATTYEDPSIDTAAGRLAAFGHPYHVRICGADYG